jgi:hypothetical protein
MLQLCLCAEVKDEPSTSCIFGISSDDDDTTNEDKLTVVCDPLLQNTAALTSTRQPKQLNCGFLPLLPFRWFHRFVNFNVTCERVKEA